VVWVVDVIAGTGMRPHEVFAVLLEDIDLDAPEPYLDVTGTLVEVKGKWVRKPAPKTDNGWRRILLPAHTVEAVREAIKDLEVGDRPNPMGLLFPARNGSLRNPNNFGRTWRAARGESFAWVTRARSAKARPLRSIMPTVTPNAPPVSSATPARSPRRTTSTHPRPFRTIETCSSGGLGAPPARKREISVRSARIRARHRNEKTPSDAGRKGFSESG
jgi:hypothetical protein